MGVVECLLLQHERVPMRFSIKESATSRISETSSHVTRPSPSKRLALLLML